MINVTCTECGQSFKERGFEGLWHWQTCVNREICESHKWQKHSLEAPNSGNYWVCLKCQWHVLIAPKEDEWGDIMIMDEEHNPLLAEVWRDDENDLVGEGEALPPHIMDSATFINDRGYLKGMIDELQKALSIQTNLTSDLLLALCEIRDAEDAHDMFDTAYDAIEEYRSKTSNA